MSQEFTKTESLILGALSKLDECLLNPQLRTASETVPGTFRNTDVENQEPTADRSPNDPHPEVRFSACYSRDLIGSDAEEVSHTKYTLLTVTPVYWAHFFCGSFFGSS